MYIIHHHWYHDLYPNAPAKRSVCHIFISWILYTCVREPNNSHVSKITTTIYADMSRRSLGTLFPIYQCWILGSAICQHVRHGTLCRHMVLICFDCVVCVMWLQYEVLLCVIVSTRLEWAPGIAIAWQIYILTNVNGLGILNRCV